MAPFFVFYDEWSGRSCSRLQLSTSSRDVRKGTNFLAVDLDDFILQYQGVMLTCIVDGNDLAFERQLMHWRQVIIFLKQHFHQGSNLQRWPFKADHTLSRELTEVAAIAVTEVCVSRSPHFFTTGIRNFLFAF